MDLFSHDTGTAVRVVGLVQMVLVSVIAIRLLSYWRSFIFAWRRYRAREWHSDASILAVNPPHLKIQITTRGSEGSSEVVLRGINSVLATVQESPALARFFSVEVVTESAEQVAMLEARYAGGPVPVSGLVVPADYQTPNGTGLKARGLHYAVEARRDGWNHRPGRVFIVHFDEESVMLPTELRKLLKMLAETDKKILEGPIYYPGVPALQPGLPIDGGQPSGGVFRVPGGDGEGRAAAPARLQPDRG